MDSNRVYNALTETLAANKTRIELMSQYAGGWEGWLQCELALRWNPGEVEREAGLWQDGRACDLWFPSTNFCVELKCFGLNRAYKTSGTPRHMSDIASTYTAWSRDILRDAQKLEELPDTWNGLSIVVVPTWLRFEALAIIKDQLSERTYSWQEREGFYIALRKKGWL